MNFQIFPPLTNHAIHGSNTLISNEMIKGILSQAEAKYYCVDELVLGTEQSLGKLGVEVRFDQNLSCSKIKDDFQGIGCGANL